MINERQRILKIGQVETKSCPKIEKQHWWLRFDLKEDQATITTFWGSFKIIETKWANWQIDCWSDHQFKEGDCQRKILISWSIGPNLQTSWAMDHREKVFKRIVKTSKTDFWKIQPCLQSQSWWLCSIVQQIGTKVTSEGYKNDWSEVFERNHWCDQRDYRWLKASGIHTWSSKFKWKAMSWSLKICW